MTEKEAAGGNFAACRQAGTSAIVVRVSEAVLGRGNRRSEGATDYGANVDTEVVVHEHDVVLSLFVFRWGALMDSVRHGLDKLSAFGICWRRNKLDYVRKRYEASRRVVERCCHVGSEFGRYAPP